MREIKNLKKEYSCECEIGCIISKIIDKEFANRSQTEIDGTISFEYVLNEQLIEKLNKDIEL